MKIGPYLRQRIILCSADASPRSQRNYEDQAQYFFPDAKWVGTLRNASRELNCSFVILTAAHGMVNPGDIISPYDMHIRDFTLQVQQNWEQTIPIVIGNNQYDIMIFYAGGCPRDEMLEVMLPILRQERIDLFSFGKPNMYDVDKINEITNLLQQGVSLDVLRSILGLPERLIFKPWANA
ncbi:MAG: hypothetical protein L6290_05535 [Thermodesulfovibrionales bacterium]|nr:hypothetical protein [Thermodesulfovibrionales bacterium]